MTIFLKASGIFSSLLLIITGIQVTYLNIDLDSLPGQQASEKALFNHIGTAFIGFGCFTGPLLFGIASLIERDGNCCEHSNPSPS